MATKKKTAKKGLKKVPKKPVKKAAIKSAKKATPKKTQAKKKTHPKKKAVVKIISKPRISTETLESALQPVTATIRATFTNTNPGLSELNATLNGVKKTLTQTGTLAFDNTVSGDAIIIQGKSLGTSDISIDVPASPQKQTFPPGTFNFNFIIL